MCRGVETVIEESLCAEIWAFVPQNVTRVVAVTTPNPPPLTMTASPPACEPELGSTDEMKGLPPDTARYVKAWASEAVCWDGSPESTTTATSQISATDGFARV